MNIKEKLQKEKEQLENLYYYGLLFEDYFDGWVSRNDDKLVFRTDGLSGLTLVRDYLRGKLGFWEDSIVQIWPSQGEHIVCYQAKNHPVEIWVGYPIGELPSGLLKDGCHEVTEEITEKVTRIVCDRATS